MNSEDNIVPAVTGVSAASNLNCRVRIIGVRCFKDNGGSFLIGDKYLLLDHQMDDHKKKEIPKVLILGNGAIIPGLLCSIDTYEYVAKQLGFNYKIIEHD